MAALFSFSTGKAAVTAAILGAMALSSVPASAQSYRSGYNNSYDRDRNYNNRYNNPREAVNQCTRAAERDIRRYSRTRVGQITDVDRKRDGYRIKGRIVQDDRRGHYSRDRRDNGRFTCDIRNGRVQNVKFSGLRR